MVGSFGEVQVMDWGLAKVLLEGGVADEHEAADDVAAVTQIADVAHRGIRLGISRPAPSSGRPRTWPPSRLAGASSNAWMSGPMSSAWRSFAGPCSSPPFQKAPRGKYKAQAAATSPARQLGSTPAGPTEHGGWRAVHGRPGRRTVLQRPGVVARRVNVYTAGVQERLHAAERVDAQARTRRELGKPRASRKPLARAG